MEHSILQERAANWWRVGTLTKKATLNALASAVDGSARIAVELIVNPILLAGFGDVLFGIWRVIYQFMGYAWAAGGRSSQALRMVVASEQTIEGRARKQEHVGAAVAVWFLFFPISLAVCALAVVFLPSLLEVPADLVPAVRIAVAILLANGVLVGLTDIPRAVLAGENLGYRRVGLSALVVLMTGVFTVGAIRADLGITGVALATTAGTLLNAALFITVAKQYVNWFGIARPSWRSVRWLGSKSVGFFLWKWINQFLTAGDVLLVGILGSPSMVTVYSLTKYAPDAVIRLTGFLVNGSSAGFGHLLSDQRFAKLRRTRSELMTATWLVATVSGVAVLMWSPSFLTLWVGPGYDPGLVTTVLIIVLAAQLMFVRNDSSLIDLTLKLRSKVLLGVATIAMTAVILVAFVTSNFEITTLCLALVIGRMPMSIGYPRIVGRVLEISASQQLRACVRGLLASGLLLSIAAFLRGSLEAPTWFLLGISVGLTIIVGSVLAILLGMDTTQQSRILKRLAALV